eukprot:NODE_3159_length_1268_cov_103.391266_g3000_i0.p1 GENE.NODE_3159_length_1268_cov_103.391266_g3000_i0~~NODE_3159_length_1268_cov_103.391266_g3000_i0.p1  ORF type:complete len:402 (-),score=65.44 NODE_3159_length_1268_cov_103.391266_g3000_i0:4-1209(-)
MRIFPLVVVALHMYTTSAALWLGASGVSYPNDATTTITLASGTVRCQEVRVPVGGCYSLNLGFWSGNYSASTAPTYTLSMHEGATRFWFQRSGTAQLGMNTVAIDTNPVTLIPAGTYQLCITAPSSSLQVSVYSKTISLWQHTGKTAPPADPTTGGTVVQGNAMAVFLQGDEQGIWNFPYSVSFDDFARCSGACTIDSGVPCPLKLGWQNPTNDDFDWTVYNGPTPTKATGQNTGPSFDSTTRDGTTAGGNYIYAEGSDSCGRGKTAFLVTPPIELGPAWESVVTFKYHMYGAGGAELRFDASFDDGTTWVTNTHTRLTGNYGDAWYTKTLDFTPTIRPYIKAARSSYRIRFRAITGNNTERWFESDIGLDDFFFEGKTDTPSITYSPTPTQSPTATRTLR